MALTEVEKTNSDFAPPSFQKGDLMGGVSRMGLSLAEQRAREQEVRNSREDAQNFKRRERIGRRAYRDALRRGDSLGAFNVLNAMDEKGLSSGGIRQSGAVEGGLQNRFDRAVGRKAGTDSVASFQSDLNRSALVLGGDKGAVDRAVQRGASLGLSEDQVFGFINGRDRSGQPAAAPPVASTQPPASPAATTPPAVAPFESLAPSSMGFPDTYQSPAPATAQTSEPVSPILALAEKISGTSSQPVIPREPGFDFKAARERIAQERSVSDAKEQATLGAIDQKLAARLGEIDQVYAQHRSRVSEFNLAQGRYEDTASANNLRAGLDPFTSFMPGYSGVRPVLNLDAKPDPARILPEPQIAFNEKRGEELLQRALGRYRKFGKDNKKPVASPFRLPLGV